MNRTYVVTGSAAGIGEATKKLLVERGNRVIGVDLRNADVIADLSSAAGRQDMVSQVTELSGGIVDGVIACAGVSVPPPVVAKVNYFGMVATLEGFRPLLARSKAPRAVAVSSFAAIWPGNDDLLAAFKANDEARAIEIAETIGADDQAMRAKLNWPEHIAGPNPAYHSAKLALTNWIRRMAPTPDWAGAGIALNVIAPGMIITALTEDVLKDEEALKASEAAIPRPLNGLAEPIVVAKLLAWLTSEENTHLCGQMIFIDGGAEAITRGEDVI